MKIIAIYQNNQSYYKSHNSSITKFPVLYLLSDTSIIRTNRPFYYPDFSTQIIAEADFVIKISRVGKNIPEKFASRYYEEIGMGIRFTAEDLFSNARDNGLPWTISKSWEGSVALGKFLKLSEFPENSSIINTFKINDKLIQTTFYSDLCFSFNKLIAYISKYFTLKMGDLIFTGSSIIKPEIKINDCLIVYLNDYELLNFHIK